MPTISMPQVRENTQSGTVLQWLKGVGDVLAAGDILVRIETESELVELELVVAGRLAEILVPEGRTAVVGSTLCRIDTEGDKSAEAQADMSAKMGSGAGVPSVKKDGSDAHATAVIPILMPQAGQSMEEGTLVEWRVKEGDRIEKGQVIFEVETDKATVEVEADHGGRLARIVVQADEIVAVKVPVAYLAEKDTDIDAYLAAQESSAPLASASSIPSTLSTSSTSSTPAPAPSAPIAPDGRVKASPAARKAASEKGLDLSSVGAGSGPGGRVLTGDIAAAPAASSEAGAPTRRRMSGMRRAIARALTTSKQTIPHFYMRLTIDAGPLMKAQESRRKSLKCSLNDFVVSACAQAIQQFPEFRGRLDGEEIVEFPSANIGIAVGLDDGLVVPVVVGADRMAFGDLAAETRRVVRAARSGRVEGVGQGVFTVTNLGMFGVEEFSAIINPPETAILAVGAVREEPVVKDGEIRPGRVMTMTLSCDHRLIDGLLAAKFCARLKELLESPETL
ncbi:2-oxo acid dehydrogenase subunit E2 [Candidatus Sumerlaeota bacterium]|nr:2-oxo acid dehydrogenase subunit E2 [Candidatus Sumerlaeota bacterium]